MSGRKKSMYGIWRGSWESFWSCSKRGNLVVAKIKRAAEKKNKSDYGNVYKYWNISEGGMHEIKTSWCKSWSPSRIDTKFSSVCVGDKHIREGVVKELLYADDLVQVGDNWLEVASRYTRWKKAVQDKEVKINANQTKFLYKKKFCTNTNLKVSLLCTWQKSGKELCAVHKMSTLGAQQVFCSS